MPRVRLDCITMIGNEFALFPLPDGGHGFPTTHLDDNTPPADAVRELVEATTGTTDPKLELVDLLTEPHELALVFRAILTDEPQTPHQRTPRPELPEKLGTLTGPWVHEALKTSLNYKLTRR